MQLKTLFAVPIAQLRLPDAARLNAELRTLLLSRETAEHRNPHPSMIVPQGLYESRFDLFSWTDAPVLKLRQHCWGALSHLIAQLNGYTPNDLHRIEIKSHTWFHITRRGGWFGIHNHPMAAWSGVYCVDGGRHDPDRPDSGLLRFINPMSIANMYVDAANARLQPPFHTGNSGFRLEGGDLVLFPSWLQHEVLPFYGEGERITIAFNCWFPSRT